MTVRNRVKNPLWFIAPDFLLMLLSLRLALAIRFGAANSEFIQLHFQIFFPIFLGWLVIMFIHNLFDFRTLRSYLGLSLTLASAMFFNFIFAVVYFYFQPNLVLTPRRSLILVALFAYFLILLWHLIVRLALKNRIVEDYYLLGEKDDMIELEREIGSLDFLGFRLLGLTSDLRQLPVDKTYGVVVSDKFLADPVILKQIYILRLKGIQFHNHIEFYERLLQRIPLLAVGELWFVNHIGFQNNPLENLLKRILDLISGIILGILFVVTWPVIALAIKLNSSGPLFFTQPRVGQNGQSFKVYKYRSMSAASSGKGWTEVNDSRITTVGRILRRTHLDELPQFVNLILGNMSVVGPRPEQFEIVQQMRQLIPFYDERHLIKPGITGWAQLHLYAGTLEETKRKLEYDLYYLKHRSILFDLEIILKTLYFMFRKI